MATAAAAETDKDNEVQHVLELLKKQLPPNADDVGFFLDRKPPPSVRDVSPDVETVEDLENLKEAGAKLAELRKSAREKTFDDLRGMSFSDRQRIIDRWVANTHPERDKLRYDPRFPNQNITKRCWVNFVDMHRCLRDFNSRDTCSKYIRASQALCPQEWADAWDEELKNNLFPGIIVKPRPLEQVAKILKIDPKLLREFAAKHAE